MRMTLVFSLPFNIPMSLYAIGRVSGIGWQCTHHKINEYGYTNGEAVFDIIILQKNTL